MKTKKSEKDLLGILNRRKNTRAEYEAKDPTSEPKKPILSRTFDGESAKRFITVGIDTAKTQHDRTVTTIWDASKVKSDGGIPDGRAICQQIVDSCGKRKSTEQLLEALNKYKKTATEEKAGINPNTFLTFFVTNEDEKKVPFSDDEVVSVEYDEKFVTLRVIPKKELNMGAFLGDNRRDSFGSMALNLLTYNRDAVAITFTNMRFYSIESSVVIKSSSGFFQGQNEAPFNYVVKFYYEKAH